MKLLYVWAEKIETTLPGATQKTYKAGPRHACFCGVMIPLRLAYWLHARGWR